MAISNNSQLGLALVEAGYLNHALLLEALSEQRRTGRLLGQILLDNNYVNEEQIARTIGIQQNIPFVDLRKFDVSPPIVKLLTEMQVRRFKAIVLEDRSDSYFVGFTDPTNLRSQDELASLLGRPVYVCIITQSQFNSTIDRIYGKSDELEQIADDVKREIEKEQGVLDIDTMAISIDDNEAPVVKLLQSIFDEAVRMEASDIHIEPQEQALVVRFRIDGDLMTQFEADPKIISAMMVRLKLLASLDIAERRIPQDGRITVKARAKRVDVRVSTIPTQFGESAVMRLLPQSDRAIDLQQLGMSDELFARFHPCINSPHGIVLVTGPTGSGSTTLYGALELLNQPNVKILTVEDPVEYRIRGISQVQVNEKIDLSFASMLRAFLRQDPDIILVGEIRDEETAEVAVRAAMTGHLVLSTLHTNDAAGTPARLLDMGIPAYLIASTLLGVIAQRLVRVVCEYCAEDYQPSEDELAWLSQFTDRHSHFRFRKGQGCNRCNGIGYRGRTGIYEFLEMTPELSAMMNKTEPDQFEIALRNQLAGKDIASELLGQIAVGKTTISEAMGVLTSMRSTAG